MVTGDQVVLEVLVYDDRGEPLLDRGVDWASVDSLIAVVDQVGMVEGRSVGATQVRATAEGVVGEASVSVMEPPIASVIVTSPLPGGIAPRNSLTTSLRNAWRSASGPSCSNATLRVR